jgi:hypothetical protein
MEEDIKILIRQLFESRVEESGKMSLNKLREIKKEIRRLCNEAIFEEELFTETDNDAFIFGAKKI